VCVCVYVCVCRKGKVLEVDCKVRGASIRCGLERGMGRQYWVAVVEQVFSTIKESKKKHKKYTLIIPLSDWTIIYFASMPANSVISSILALRSSCTLNPCPQHPCVCVWSVYTRYVIKYIFDVPLYTWFTVFIICGLL
jgi:hypothetical protein